MAASIALFESKESTKAASVKALTLWQPWAQAVALGLKKFETRSWATRHRGRLLIHASVRPMNRECRALASRYGLSDCPLGMIVAEVELVDCLLMTPELIAAQAQTEIAFGDWREGRYAWQLANLKIFEIPIPAKGLQGLWTCRGNLALEQNHARH